MEIKEPAWLPSLRDLLATVRSPEPGKEGLGRLMGVLAEVEVLLAQYRGEMPAELIHFLERRSYEKAARYCDGGFNIPKGTCGAKT